MRDPARKAVTLAVNERNCLHPDVGSNELLNLSDMELIHLEAGARGLATAAQDEWQIRRYMQEVKANKPHGFVGGKSNRHYWKWEEAERRVRSSA